MKEKLTELIKQAKYCTAEELADYLLSAGLVLPDGEIDFDYNAEDVCE
jgi:hypothetical protein